MGASQNGFANVQRWHVSDASQKVAASRKAAFTRGFSLYRVLICLHFSCHGFFWAFSRLSSLRPGSCRVKTKALILFLLVGQGRTKCVFVSGRTHFAGNRPSVLHAQTFIATFCDFFPSIKRLDAINQMVASAASLLRAQRTLPTLFLMQGRHQLTVTRWSSNWGDKLWDISPQNETVQRCLLTRLAANNVTVTLLALRH